MVAEPGFAHVFEVLLASPRGPLVLPNGLVPLKLGAYRFKRYATVARNGLGGLSKLRTVEALAAELHDINVVTPSGACDATLQIW